MEGGRPDATRFFPDGIDHVSVGDVQRWAELLDNAAGAEHGGSVLSGCQQPERSKISGVAKSQKGSRKKKVYHRVGITIVVIRRAESLITPGGEAKRLGDQSDDRD